MQNLVELHANKPVTTTLKVAEFFGKDHHNVLKALNKLFNSEKESLTDVTFNVSDNEKTFFESNFNEITYEDATGRVLLAYEKTKSGLAQLPTK